ncbi:MAG: hypothetical protein ACYCXJ_07040 [Thermoleophilia bacterium]
MKKIIFMAVAGLMLGGCAPQQFAPETASGTPETFFKNDTAERVRGAITKACINEGLTIEDSSTSQVVCSAEVKGTMEIIRVTLALNGNAGSSTPIEKARFMIIEEPGGIRVMAQSTMELHLSGGAVRVKQITDERSLQGLQSFLNLIPGTGLSTADKLILFGPRIQK